MRIERLQCGDTYRVVVKDDNYQASLQVVDSIERIIINGKVKSRRVLREILKEMRG